MKKHILTTTLIAFISLSSYSLATDAEPKEPTKEDSLAEASALLVQMNSKSQGGTEVAKANILEKYMAGEITADDGVVISTGEKSLDEVELEQAKMIDEIADAEAKELIEEAKEKEFLQDKKPKNEELAEKFARGEITAGEGYQIEKKIDKEKISEAKAMIEVKLEKEQAQKDAIKDDGFISKVKGWFGK